MSMKVLMLEQLEIARRIVTDGHENVPAWRIETPDGAWLILTRFDPDKPGQSDRALHLVRRFMAWKFAQAFVMTAETWLGPTITRTGEEAVTAVGASRSERLGVIQRIRRKGAAVEFGPLEWLAPEQMDYPVLDAPASSGGNRHRQGGGRADADLRRERRAPRAEDQLIVHLSDRGPNNALSMNDHFLTYVSESDTFRPRGKNGDQELQGPADPGDL